MPSYRRRLIPHSSFVDIALGLVVGANEGAGLGNKFLHNIRDVDAILHVVRCACCSPVCMTVCVDSLSDKLDTHVLIHR